MSSPGSSFVGSMMVRVDGGIDCPTDITLLCNHRRFVVEVARSTFSLDPPQLGTATEAETEEIYDAAVASLVDSLMMLLQPFYRELAPFRDQLALDELLQPFCFTLSIDGQVLQRDPAREAVGRPPRLGIDLGTVPQSVRRIRPKDVIVLRELMGENVCKVSVHGEIMCYKKGGWQHTSLVREYTALKKLVDHGLPYRIRVPLLKGIVVLKDEDPVMALGVLMTYIDPDPPQYTLSHVKLDSVPQEQRKRWAMQIRSMLKELHENGVIWGDAKLNNVLLDREGNACVQGLIYPPHFLLPLVRPYNSNPIAAPSQDALNLYEYGL
ncbi:MAG: hypothetical protein M1826_001117 [Phylliscum demangeonii]|nr:MAG: hypothetical protein M1826_001117 [Phylliscum demangeonii]